MEGTLLEDGGTHPSFNENKSERCGGLLRSHSSWTRHQTRTGPLLVPSRAPALSTHIVPRRQALESPGNKKTPVGKLVLGPSVQRAGCPGQGLSSGLGPQDVGRGDLGHQPPCCSSQDRGGFHSFFHPGMAS